jgi:HEXXH motif-containing protein
MLPQLRLFDLDFLSSLLQEFRDSMRDLLADLCEELRNQYRHQAKSLRLPLDYFRLAGERLDLQDYSTWRVVGWIEELNDLVYFVDLQTQLRGERDATAFAEALFAECEEKFYEHSYLDDVFSDGRPQANGLAQRLDRLCKRLARQVIQESVFLVPGLLGDWMVKAGLDCWTVPADLGPNFERAELPGRLYLGLNGAYLDPPAALRRMLAEQDWRATLLIRPRKISLRVGKEVVPLLTCETEAMQSHWRKVTPCAIRPANASGRKALTLGAVLEYGRERKPVRVTVPPLHLTGRIRDALAVIEQAWPSGANLFAALTSRVVPLRALGVVSFSYRHRPGLSFINTFDRGQLDLIDDLIHENSHHHLNLLLRKYVFYRGDHNQEIFYSPWRQSLRPLRGILHATFTFTMGAILFERLSSWTERVGESRVLAAGLSKKDVLRARFRCLEEVESVRYSLRDLDYAATELGWMTATGTSLVESLRHEIERVTKRIAPYEASVLRSRYGVELRRYRQELAVARKIYGPVRDQTLKK